MSSEVFYAMGVITFIRARADRARREGFNERGASAIEWAIIAAIVLGIVISVVAVLVGALDD